METIKRLFKLIVTYLIYWIFIAIVNATIPVCHAAPDDAVTVISNFMKTTPPVTNKKFLIQGWRWHTMSLIHEAQRLHRIASNMQDSDLSSYRDLQTVSDYLVEFNMRALRRIENELFFPWIREKTKSIKDRNVSCAFDSVLLQLERESSRLELLGSTLMDHAKIASNILAASDERARAVAEIAMGAATIASSAKLMLQHEEEIIVPAVVRLSSETEQKSMNNKVIRKLGVLDARLHLVGMHEAIVDNNEELKLFHSTIPTLPQQLIPRWRRLMYAPRAGVLDKFLSQ